MLQPTTTGELALEVMRLQATAFAEHVSQTGADPEHVHDSRVAVRRMRAALRLFKDVLPDAETLDAELRWVADELGPVRDLDVQLKRLHATAEHLEVADALRPFEAWLVLQHDRAQTEFDTAFHSDRFIALLESLRQLNQAAPVACEATLEEDAPRRLQRAYKTLRKRADDLCPESPPESFHRARIGAKRLRYAAEFFEPLYTRAARRLIDRVTELQDVLGDHQDGIVDARRIHDAIAEAGSGWPAETSMALGRLVQWEAQHGAELREQFKPAYDDVKAAYRRLKASF